MILRIGTRGSVLALKQTETFVAAISKRFSGLTVEVVEVKTTGDRKQGTPLADRGDKKDWILELEQGILAGELDLAVNSGKDVPCDISPDTGLHAVLQRENPYDCFIGRVGADGTRLTFAGLPRQAKVGCASLRRAAQLLQLRPDLRLTPVRGNVTSRLRKLDESDDLSGIVLACAGLDRLGHSELAQDSFSATALTPAINQGMLVVQYKASNAALVELLKGVSEPDAITEFDAERGVVAVLGADCHSAVGIFARANGDRVGLQTRVLSLDGSECLELAGSAPRSEAHALGQKLGQDLLDRGAGRILEQCRERR